MCLAIRRNPTNVFLLCDVKAMEPQAADDGLYTLTHVLARCPRAVRVVGLCEGQSNMWKAFIFGT